MAGMIGGAVLGAVVGAGLITATVVTGGAAAVAVAGLVAGGALASGQFAGGLQTVMGMANPTTGVISQGSPDVRVNGKPAVRAGVDFAATCSGLFNTHHFTKPMARVAEGSAIVRVNGRPAGRTQDRLECAATITEGSPTVFIGGPAEAVLAVRDHEATWTKAATVVALLAVGGGAVAAALAGTAALVGFTAVGAGGLALNAGLGWVGDRLGPGWRDVLQGGAGVVRIVARVPKEARALGRQQQRRATRARVGRNLGERAAARRANNLAGPRTAPNRTPLTPKQQSRVIRSLVRQQRATAARRVERWGDRTCRRAVMRPRVGPWAGAAV